MDEIEVYSIGKKNVRWRFRFVLDGELLFGSARAYDTREAAEEVASKVNRLMFDDHYTVQRAAGLTEEATC